MARLIIKTIIFISLLILIYFLLLWNQAIQKSKDKLINEILNSKWICYAPTHYNPVLKIYPSRESIIQDLIKIKNAGFDGIITYESTHGLEKIPVLARKLNLKVIEGIWNPILKTELDNALSNQEMVIGYCIGNEGINSRYTFRNLAYGISYLADHSKKPGFISEQVQQYLEDPELLKVGDLIFPIIHPYFAGIMEEEEAIEWITIQNRKLMAYKNEKCPEKKIIYKEIGMPSGGNKSYTIVSQMNFYNHLFQRINFKYAIFEAFDRKGWEHISSVEPYWGIFYSNRDPKPVIHEIVEYLNRH